MERTLIAERFTCGHVVVASIVPSSRTLWSRFRNMITTSTARESCTVQCEGLCPTCRKRRIATPAVAVATGPNVALAAIIDNQAIESGDLSTAKLSGYESFDFGFDAADFGVEQIALMVPDIGEEAENQDLTSLRSHACLWQPPTPNTQQPVVEEGLWFPLAAHYNKYLYSYSASPFQLPEEINALGITFAITPPLVPQGVRDRGATLTLGESSGSNFLQVPQQISNVQELPASAETPQRIIDPGLPEGASELQSLLLSQEESSSWSDWDSDETSSLDESEEKGIDWAEARPPKPEKRNHVDQFLDQQFQYAGYTYEEDQVPSSSASTSKLPNPPVRPSRGGIDHLDVDNFDAVYSSYSSWGQQEVSSPKLTPAQKIILEYQEIQAQREAHELECMKQEVYCSSPKTRERQAISQPSPLRQVFNAYEEDSAPHE